MRISTIGYEGVTISQFFSSLEYEMIEILVDVRETPLSRKSGFSKKALREASNALGIQYLHFGSLGCPKDIRNNYKQDANWMRYTSRFLEYLDSQDEELKRLENLTRNNHCCLMCFEADYFHCHRRYIANELKSRIGQELFIKHLDLITKAIPVSQKVWVDIPVQQ